MKKIAGIFASLVFSFSAFAIDPSTQPELILDTVVFQVAAKQWVGTQTALLTVSINATLTNADLIKARKDIIDKLVKIAPGEWHLTQFDRSQDNSGLEKLYVQAEARIPQSNLTSVYQNAKSVSLPGATYNIASMEFKPSLEEIQQVRSQLRERLYQQARDELQHLNKVYAGQNYSLNNLVFDEGMNVTASPKIATMNAIAMPESVANVTISNELMMTATVKLASNRNTGKS